MPSKGLALVTGVNGYIAARAVESFLQAGYSVRGTARSVSTTSGLRHALVQYEDKLEIVEVADITVKGAFDEAVKGVDIVAHIAAPVSFSFTDPEPVMKGAVEGVSRILESAHHEPSVKSFVFMSSIAAVKSVQQGNYTFTEKDWNTQAEAAVAAQGKSTPPPIIYAASKTAAERALWKFRDEKQPKFSVTSINPVFVYGPPLVAPTTSDKIGETYMPVWKVYTGKSIEESGIKGAVAGCVDVRDVGRITVWAAANPEKANGERYITSSGYGSAQVIADVLRKAYPERTDIIAKGTPGEGYLTGYQYPLSCVYDGSKAAKATGQDYIPLEKTIVDTAEALKHIV